MSIRIIHDEDPSSPRDNDNLGEMVCWHSRYSLGDRQPNEDPVEYQKSIPDGSIVLPLYLYDHSGITMSTKSFGCEWDSGQVGFIVATPKKLRAEYDAEWNKPEVRAKAEEALRAEVSQYDEFITGNYWGFEKLDKNGEVADACWGFSGSDPFTNGMSDHIDKSDWPKLAVAAKEAGLSHSFTSKTKAARGPR
jgi:hypothetical protein